ncbi:AAA family ATPase [Parerythrobacter jejuensis]|uniref:AAA family ATPase n=1 Tax=Parerythrobacter jejuensis TaxID=795812 RepID=A0A845AQY3_9SPHN|nr:AAA family ATPase [Parerythrobacter jejuensis]MXP31879.1 AAA family ATPase [Parerythrobacter jejuensis]
MMKQKGFVLLSGMPASGKTAIGRALAERFCWPCLDKDDLLEAEFEKYEDVDLIRRQKLSRLSDLVFEQRAKAQSHGVLVSFWRPIGQPVSYGTATNWLTELQSPVVELHCRCDPTVAQERFAKRKRHPGHNDALRHDTLVQQFAELAAFGPLGTLPCVTIDTSDLTDIDALVDEAAEEVRALLVWPRIL